MITAPDKFSNEIDVDEHGPLLPLGSLLCSSAFVSSQALSQSGPDSTTRASRESGWQRPGTGSPRLSPGLR